MSRQIIPVTALRWAVGLVVLIEALHFALSPATAAQFARTWSWGRDRICSGGYCLHDRPRETVRG